MCVYEKQTRWDGAAEESHLCGFTCYGCDVYRHDVREKRTEGDAYGYESNFVYFLISIIYEYVVRAAEPSGVIFSPPWVIYK